jgi:hypothetical protein
MRLASAKFKHLDSVQAFLVPETVPAFRVIQQLVDITSFDGPYILRSALKNEGQKGQLLSGKSLSIGDIDSRQKLNEAWEKISSQVDLEEVILQEEIKWDSHITLTYEKDFFFSEIKKQNGLQQFIYWTPLAQTLSFEVQLIKKFLKPLESYLLQEKCWLMEAGILNGKIYLFQIHPVSLDLLSTIFSSEMVGQIVSSRMRFAKSQGLWGLIKTEWKARSFRHKMKDESFHPSLIFLNWEFLFHYFRIFCMLNQLGPDAQSFAKFLAMSFEKNWMSSLVKKHLELANFFRKNEAFDPMNLGFESNGLIFIGKGTLEGTVGDEIHTCDEISLALIYQKSARPRVILTKEVGLLSHPVLASVENGVYLVLGMSELPNKGARIHLDFDQKVIRIE